MNIVLIGYRCSGKTSVGSGLAARVDRPFFDTDELVQRIAGKSVEGLVTEGGWELFRRMETLAIREAVAFDGGIIATGGGSVLDPDNVRRMKANGWVIWLKADPEVVKSRMAKDEESGKVRPSLTDRGSLEEIRSVVELRSRIYEAAADFSIDTRMKTVDEVADEIEAAMPELIRKKLSWLGTP